MPDIRSLHFNAHFAEAAENIPDLLVKPTTLDALLDLPDDVRGMEISADERETADKQIVDWNSETAARHYLQELLEGQNNERLLEVASPSRPELVPDLRLEHDRRMTVAGSRNVSFVQTSRSVPIFGTRSTVEIEDRTMRLKAVDGLMTDVPDLSPIPSLGIPDVLVALAEYLDIPRDDLHIDQPPTLQYYLDNHDRVGNEATPPDRVEWKLAYLIEDVPVVEDSEARINDESGLSCGVCGPFGSSPNHFLVDANSGDVLLRYPAYALLDVPVVCTGTDVDGNPQHFDGIQLNATKFQLTDPLRAIDTCDANFADIATTGVTATPVVHSSASFPTSANAAVTAHVLASQVFDFFNSVLKRNGIDDKGMKLVSMVNCYSSVGNSQPSPFWRNASWWKGRMWYGSSNDGGTAVSTSRFLDVMAHELAHGVTSTTANLVYKNESGALNESFSDIFGVMINNWAPGNPNPLAGWSWRIGDGWRGAGTVLRDMQDPTRGLAIWPAGDGQPAHMTDYVNTTKDNGGVHINSGIHNRAFYNVVMSVDASGDEIIQPLDIALLYYLTLTKLAPLATFRDCRRTLLNVATTRFAGNSPADRNTKLKAIRDAYDAVGII